MRNALLGMPSGTSQRWMWWMMLLTRKQRLWIPSSLPVTKASLCFELWITMRGLLQYGGQLLVFSWPGLFVWIGHVLIKLPCTFLQANGEEELPICNQGHWLGTIFKNKQLSFSTSFKDRIWFVTHLPTFPFFWHSSCTRGYVRVLVTQNLKHSKGASFSTFGVGVY